MIQGKHSIDSISIEAFKNPIDFIDRGTKLLADRMQDIHTVQVQHEAETLEKLKERVERIKANQQKFEPNLIAAKTHHEGNFNQV